MAKQNGQGRDYVEATSKVGNVTIAIAGQTRTKQSVLSDLAQELATSLYGLNLPGEYKMAPVPGLIRGTSATKGLSVQGIKNSSVLIAYQPGGNDTRQLFHLFVAPDLTHKMFRLLKDFLSSKHLPEVSEDEPEATMVPSVVEMSTTDKIAEISSVPGLAFEKPAQKPAVYYTQDATWLEDTILELSCLADKDKRHVITQAQVVTTILARTHFEKAFGLGPIMSLLKDRGYLVPLEDTPDHFKMVEIPPIGFKRERPWKRKKKFAPKQKSKVVTTKKVRSTTSERKQKYLSDEEWMRSFMDGLRELVVVSGGLVSKTDLQRFIKECTNQKKIAGMVYKVLDGLEVRGLIISAGDKLYKVVYEPKPDTLKKAVEAMEVVRAEKTQVFAGLAPVRMPHFAEVMFQNPLVMMSFLTKMPETEISSSRIQKFLGDMLPGRSGVSYQHLVKYLCAQGYVLRPRHGIYTLGPKGRELLGLPPVVYTTVDKLSPPAPAQSESAEVVPSPVEQTVETPVVQESKPMLSQAPQTFMPVVDNAVPPVSPEEIAATVTAISKAKRNKAAAEEVEARKAALQARKAELQARRDELRQRKEEGPSPEAVQAAVMQKLIAMAHEL